MSLNYLTEFEKSLSANAVESLAVDLVLHFESDPEGVLSAHKLTTEELTSLLTAPESILKATVQKLREQIKDDPAAAVRIEARGMVRDVLPQLYNIAMSSEADQDRLKAIAQIVELADVKPKKQETKAATGTVVKINLGGLLPQPVTIEAQDVEDVPITKEIPSPFTQHLPEPPEHLQE